MILFVYAELKLKSLTTSSSVDMFTVPKKWLELFENPEKVKPNFLSLSAKNQVFILLYGSQTNNSKVWIKKFLKI